MALPEDSITEDPLSYIILNYSYTVLTATPLTPELFETAELIANTIGHAGDICAMNVNVLWTLPRQQGQLARKNPHLCSETILPSTGDGGQHSSCQVFLLGMIVFILCLQNQGVV